MEPSIQSAYDNQIVTGRPVDGELGSDGLPIMIGRPVDVPPKVQDFNWRYTDHRLWAEPRDGYLLRKSYLDLNYCVTRHGFSLEAYTAPLEISGGHLHSTNFEEQLRDPNCEAYLQMNENDDPLLFFRYVRPINGVVESNVNMGEYVRFQPSGRVEFVHPLDEGIPEWLQRGMAIVDMAKSAIDRSNQSALEGAIDEASGWLDRYLNRNNVEPDVAAWFKGTYVDDALLIRPGHYT